MHYSPFYIQVVPVPTSGRKGDWMRALIIRTIIGALVGFLIGLICEKTMPVILAKRKRTMYQSDNEKRFLLGVMSACGAVIGFRIPQFGMLVYIFLLLGISEMIAVIDWHERIIPNELWQAVIILKIIFSIPTMFGVPGFPQLNIVESLIGFVACFIIFTLPGIFKKNVGAGDVKLAAAIGFGLGMWGALYAIVFMGLMILGYSSIQKKAPLLKMLESMIPMGPFIVSGMMGVLLFI